MLATIIVTSQRWKQLLYSQTAWYSWLCQNLAIFKCIHALNIYYATLLQTNCNNIILFTAFSLVCLPDVLQLWETRKSHDRNNQSLLSLYIIFSFICLNTNKHMTQYYCHKLSSTWSTKQLLTTAIHRACIYEWTSCWQSEFTNCCLFFTEKL